MCVWCAWCLGWGEELDSDLAELVACDHCHGQRLCSCRHCREAAARQEATDEQVSEDAQS